MFKTLWMWRLNLWCTVELKWSCSPSKHELLSHCPELLFHTCSTQQAHDCPGQMHSYRLEILCLVEAKGSSVQEEEDSVICDDCFCVDTNTIMYLDVTTISVKEWKAKYRQAEEVWSIYTLTWHWHLHSHITPPANVQNSSGLRCPCERD